MSMGFALNLMLRVMFWGFEDGGTLIGVMGLQQVQDVTVIRHAYVRTPSQKRGIGAELLSHLRRWRMGRC